MPEENPEAKATRMQFSFTKTKPASAAVRPAVKKDLPSEEPAIEYVTAIEDKNIVSTEPRASTAKVIPAIENKWKPYTKPMALPDANTLDFEEEAPVEKDDGSVTYGLSVRKPAGQPAPTEAPRDLELAALRHDMETLPEAASEDAYENMPVEDFGEAMLRGMGWEKGKTIGRNARGMAAPVQYVPRQGRLGLGADPKPPSPKSKRFIKPGESRDPRPDLVLPVGPDGRVRHVRSLDEKLVEREARGIRAGKAVMITAGRHEGMRGKVLSWQGPEGGRPGRATVQLSASGERVDVLSDQVEEIEVYLENKRRAAAIASPTTNGGSGRGGQEGAIGRDTTGRDRGEGTTAQGGRDGERVRYASNATDGAREDRGGKREGEWGGGGQDGDGREGSRDPGDGGGDGAHSKGKRGSREDEGEEEGGGKRHARGDRSRSEGQEKGGRRGWDVEDPRDGVGERGRESGRRGDGDGKSKEGEREKDREKDRDRERDREGKHGSKHDRRDMEGGKDRDKGHKRDGRSGSDEGQEYGRGREGGGDGPKERARQEVRGDGHARGEGRPPREDRDGDAHKEQRSKERDAKEKEREVYTPWLAPGIVVRVVDKKLSGGRHYLCKGHIVDVPAPLVCDVLMDASEDAATAGIRTGQEMLRGVGQGSLETALPKPGGRVVAVLGPLRGERGKLMSRSSKSNAAVVQMAADFSFHTFALDEVAEYCGEAGDDE
eukprot:jgi/Mesvir1/20336/Mv19925-RA.1